MTATINTINTANSNNISINILNNINAMTNTNFMKSVLLAIVFVFTSLVNGFAADSWHVKITPSYQIPGQTYAPLTTPKLNVGLVNLKYDFTVDAKTCNHATIGCLVKFPKDFDLKLVACDGIQALKLDDDNQLAALTVYEAGEYKCLEFLMPQKKGITGFVEFQVKINRSFRGKDIPVEFVFRHYEKPFFNRWSTTIGIGCGIVAGGVVGLCTLNPATGIAAGVCTSGATTAAFTTAVVVSGAVVEKVAAGAIAAGATGTIISYHEMNEKLQDLRKEYKAVNMNESYKLYTLQIR